MALLKPRGWCRDLGEGTSAPCTHHSAWTPCTNTPAVQRGQGARVSQGCPLPPLPRSPSQQQGPDSTLGEIWGGCSSLKGYRGEALRLTATLGSLIDLWHLLRGTRAFGSQADWSPSYRLRQVVPSTPATRRRGTTVNFRVWGRVSMFSSPSPHPQLLPGSQHRMYHSLLCADGSI